MKKKTFAVVGLGQFGFAVAKTLAEEGYEVLAIDRDSESVQRIAPYASSALCADVTEPRVMETIEFSGIDVVIIGISEHLEAGIIATMYAKEAGAYVLAKANNELYGKILKKTGADEIIFPEKSTGVRVARNYISGGFKDFFDLSEEVSMVEMQLPSEWEGQSLAQLELRGRYGLNVVAVRENGKVNIDLDPQKKLQAGCTLGIVGKNEVLGRLKEKK